MLISARLAAKTAQSLALTLNELVAHGLSRLRRKALKSPKAPWRAGPERQPSALRGHSIERYQAFGRVSSHLEGPHVPSLAA